MTHNLANLPEAQQRTEQLKLKAALLINNMALPMGHKSKLTRFDVEQQINELEAPEQAQLKRHLNHYKAIKAAA
jgi:hypothetical protein